MAFANFLTQGQPLPSTSTAYTTSQVPQYLSDYLYNLMSGAYSAAQEPYQAYGGPRLTPFSPDQLAAFQATRDAAGAYRPQLTAAGQTAAEAVQLSPTEAAQPYFNVSSMSTPQVIGAYINPYVENVTSRMGDLAARQIREKLMPELGDQFIRAGQYGSTRQQELAQRGVRDISENLASQIGSTLAQAYTTAGTQAQQDLSRLGSLGQAAGTLSASEMQQLANLSNVQGQLAQREQALGIQGAGALETIGQTQQQQQQRNLDLAYQDFLAQRDYPKTQLQFLQNIVQGLPSGGGTAARSESSMGQQYSASPLAQLGSAATGALALSKLFS